MNSNDIYNAKFLRNSIRKQFKDCGAPLEGVFELTGQCNFSCKMCYIHTHPNSYYLDKQKSGEWWIQVIDEAYKAGMMFALLTGGECLLHPDFKRIYLHLINKGVYVSLNTNASMLSDELIAFLIENRPLEIQVTIYGSDEETYERVTGVRAFDRTMKVIKKITDANLPLKIAITPTGYASGRNKDIVAFVKKLGIPYNIGEAEFTPYSESGERKISDNSVSLDERISYLREGLKKEYNITRLEELPPAGGNVHIPVLGMKCGAGRYSFFCTWDGHIQPCGAFYNKKIKMNTPDEFLSIWEKIKKICKEYIQPIECEECVYRKVCINCTTLRSDANNPGHCDPAVCDMTRRLVAAGVKKLPEQNTSEEPTIEAE